MQFWLGIPYLILFWLFKVIFQGQRGQFQGEVREYIIFDK